MKKLFSVFVFALLSVAPSFAQQIYVKNIMVGYPPPPNNNPYCAGNQSLFSDVSFVTSGMNPERDSALIEFDRPFDVTGGTRPYPGACLALCANIQCVNQSTGAGSFGIDSLSFEIFKFKDGANPLDQGSTPPLRTINLYNIGSCDMTQFVDDLGWYCSGWDGSYNISGEYGKSNGQFGFRAIVKTNQVNPQVGNVAIENTAAYPGQQQRPVSIDVVNVHVVKTTPTVVGKITGVAAQPYNILYRLSKDATVQMYVESAVRESGGQIPIVRSLVNNLPRVGEGTPDGVLSNGDFWDGRDNHGNILPAGVYLVSIDARAYDEWQNPGQDNLDLSQGVTRQISLDPLQITDVRIKSLGPSSTDQAALTYMLTEAATVYVDIYPPGTNFGSINVTNDGSVYSNYPPVPQGGAQLLRRLIEQQGRRTDVTTLWDGSDSNRNTLPDGDYVYALYAELPSPVAPSGKVVTQKTIVGTIPIERGYVTVGNFQPSSTVVGSSPSVAGLNPFNFRYTLSRDAVVNATILDPSGSTVIRRLVTNEPRSAGFVNVEKWDGVGDNGYYAPPGTYLIQLTAADPIVPSKISTMTAIFPVNLFRITDVQTAPLLGGTSDNATISYTLSQPMSVNLNIYERGTIIDSTTTWPPVVVSTPIVTIQGFRPGRFKITEYWDGRNNFGLFVPDGLYTFTLVAVSSMAAPGTIPTDRIFGNVVVARGQIMFTQFNIIPTVPSLVNSSETIKLPPMEIEYAVTRQSSVTIRIYDGAGGNPPPLRATPVAGEIRDGGVVFRDFWDGKTDAGDYVLPGPYIIQVVAQDITIQPGQLAAVTTVQQSVDVFPFVIYDVATVDFTPEQGSAAILYQISVPMKTGVKIYRPGTKFDANKNVIGNEKNLLVKRIIKSQPPRVQITELWDGTDLRGAPMPDGIYPYKIYASTDPSAIDSMTGDVRPGAVLGDALSLQEGITLVRVDSSGRYTNVAAGGEVKDICGLFADSTNNYFYPNPLRSDAGYFVLNVNPVQARIFLKIYNLAGDLVYEKDFGELASGQTLLSYPGFLWNRTNSSGARAARGVYFATWRLEATQGAGTICQTVRKILIP